MADLTTILSDILDLLNLKFERKLNGKSEKKWQTSHLGFECIKIFLIKLAANYNVMRRCQIGRRVTSVRH